jgi:hypothetical protein
MKYGFVLFNAVKEKKEECALEIIAGGQMYLEFKDQEGNGDTVLHLALLNHMEKVVVALVKAVAISKSLSLIPVKVIQNEEVRFESLGLVQHISLNSLNSCDNENVVFAILHITSSVIVIGSAFPVTDFNYLISNFDTVQREILLERNNSVKLSSVTHISIQ